MAPFIRACGIAALLCLEVSIPPLFPGVTAADAGAAPPWPLLDNGLQQTVQWDHYSLVINGERAFMFGGEMHPFRLPVPELWEDILQKIKAMGMRMVSIYTHWGFHAPTPETVDFGSGAHNLTRFLQMAKDVGLYVMVRPGPYINGELNAGGIALWATTGEHGSLRSNDTAYTKAWTPYQDGVARATNPFQLTESGTVIMYQIENEYGNQWKDVQAKVPNLEAVSYMEKLEENARRNGIAVPLVHNAPNQNGRPWSKDYDTVGAGGDVDIYGLDSYPQCWSCVVEECGNITPWAVSNYFDHFQLVSPRQPEFMPEFQGGAMNPWDGPAGGCKERTGVDFVNFYYRDNIAQRVTILNLYMIYGGTNWGWLAAPFIGSSYDYGAAISEDRSIGDKFYEIKALGLFTRVADELAFTERVGANADGYTNNTNLYATELRNPETGAAFYVIRHAQTASPFEEWFSLRVNTSIGEFYVPKISSAVVLSGHEAKILVADFHFGNETLYYTTAEVLTYAIIDGKAVLVLWTPSGRSGEFYLKGAASGRVSAGPAVTFLKSEDGVIVAYTQQRGMAVVDFDNGVRVILVDRTTAYKVWVPSLTNDPMVPVDQTALVIGPYLVRSATTSGNTIAIKGDANTTTAIEVFTSSEVSRIRWNGIDLPTTKTKHSTLRAALSGPPPFPTPKIVNWKSRDALPELDPFYPDAGPGWVLANDTTTANPSVNPNTTTKPYLLADQYGFHTGIRLWRGHFSSPATGPAPTGVFLNVQGGTAHGWSAFLNGKFLGSFSGRTDAAAGNLTLSFGSALSNSNSSIASSNTAAGDRHTRNNVLLVIHDDTGHDQLSGAINPRGILNATLLGPAGSNNSAAAPAFSFTHWKVAGTAGDGRTTTGPGSPLDPLRTRYNEGGLAAERLGWHLPGFKFDSDDDDDDGSNRNNNNSNSNSNDKTQEGRDAGESGDEHTPRRGFRGAGVRFYRGTLPLDVPRGLDVSLAFRLRPVAAAAGEAHGTAFRAYLYVNGWQFGRYYPSIASEDTFPVPPGVLDYGGANVIGLAVWALREEEGARVDVEVVVRYAVSSSFDARFDGGYLRPGWDARRVDYA